MGLVLSGSSLTGCMGVLGPELPPPTTAGTHPVGVTSIELTDETRDRNVPVEIWYPAADDAKGPPTVYDVEAMGMVIAELRSPLDAHRDAAAWEDGGPRPVVLLSHGASSSRFANVSLAEVLASHGYVVAAPDHPGHTTADTVFGVSEEARAQSALDRPMDLSRVIDALDRLSAEDDGVLSGLVDMDRIAVAGHSFGGRAALAMVGAEFDVAREEHDCETDPSDRDCTAVPIFAPEAEGGRYRYRDPRVKAALLISPAGWEFYKKNGISKVDAPVLLVGGDEDKDTPFVEKQRPIFDALESPHYLLELKSAGHLTATDVCSIVESTGLLGKAVGGEKARDGCGPEFMSSRKALDRVSNASLAFFDRWLSDEPGAEERLAAALGTGEPTRVSALDPATPRTW
jgi:predicted dienelactone hydrolase